MKKLLATVLALVMALALCTSAWADENVAKIGDTEYATLAKAAQNSQDGDIITIIASTSETIPVPNGNNVTYTAAKGVELSGGAGGGYWNKSVTFDGLTFKGGKGISMTANEDGLSYTIENCTFDGVTATAVKQGVISINVASGKSVTVTVTGNEIKDVQNYTGANGSNSTGLQSNGIYICAGNGSVIVSGNVVEDVDGTGIYVKTTGTISIAGNAISEWGTGADAKNEGRAIRTDGGSTLTITENKMLDTTSTEEYVKASNVASTNMDVSNNYWGGKNPTEAGVFAMDNMTDETAKAVLKTYYTSDKMETAVSVNAESTPTGGYYYYDNSATEKIEAPKTFDAGIAMYVGMAVMSVTGMAYVGKKKF